MRACTRLQRYNNIKHNDIKKKKERDEMKIIIIIKQQIPAAFFQKLVRLASCSEQ